MEGKKPRRHSKEGKISFDKETVFGRKPTCASREKIKMIEESCVREGDLFFVAEKSEWCASALRCHDRLKSHVDTHTQNYFQVFVSYPR